MEGELEGRGAHGLALQATEGQRVLPRGNEGGLGFQRRGSQAGSAFSPAGPGLSCGFPTVRPCTGPEGGWGPSCRGCGTCGVCPLAGLFTAPATGKKTTGVQTWHVLVVQATPQPSTAHFQAEEGQAEWALGKKNWGHWQEGPAGAVRQGPLHLRKGASRLMLCQKVDGFRLGSASTRTCCWGRLPGRAGCFWRVR